MLWLSALSALATPQEEQRAAEREQRPGAWFGNGGAIETKGKLNSSALHAPISPRSVSEKTLCERYANFRICSRYAIDDIGFETQAANGMRLKDHPVGRIWQQQLSCEGVSGEALSTNRRDQTGVGCQESNR